MDLGGKNGHGFTKRSLTLSLSHWLHLDEEGEVVKK